MLYYMSTAYDLQNRCQEYSMKYIYSTSQMSKLSLTLCTFSVTVSVAGLFLTSFFFCPSTYSLYHTTWLIFTTRWILIEVGSCSLTALVNTTSSIIYGPTYQFTSFFTGLSLNTKSFVLNITLSSFFHSSTSFPPLSTCHFISSCAFLNAAPASSYTFFILSANSIAFSTFPFFLISAPILNSLL